ncbi:MAG: hypothetical protein JW746_07780 [Candidatus Krumholzibacteriota bacterium]|nr:hypothetical protein [Candidatus Krumholzibacteriota bacterium]
MNAPRTRILTILVGIAILALVSQSVFGAAAEIKKSVTVMEDGRFLIKLKVTSSGSAIYGLKLIDPEAAIVNVYAPAGWCIVTDGEDLLARTSTKPLKAGKTVEFVIHSSTDKIDYTWSVHGDLKQLGNVEKL